LHPLLEQEGRVLVKVVIGCPVYNRGWILDEWWQRSVLDQRGPWDREVVFLYSESGDDTIYKLATFAEQGEVPVTILYDKWARSEEDNVGHFWGTMPVYEKMADWRNRIKNTARESGADYFFSVDWHPHEQGEDLGWSYDLLTKGMRAFVHPGVVAEHRMVKR
jgi:hypothetical protein